MRPAEASHLIDHVAQPGETLFSLGQRYGVKPEEIARIGGVSRQYVSKIRDAA
jgi:LysM repeat protein